MIQVEIETENLDLTIQYKDPKSKALIKIMVRLNIWHRHSPKFKIISLSISKVSQKDNQNLFLNPTPIQTLNTCNLLPQKPQIII